MAAFGNNAYRRREVPNELNIPKMLPPNFREESVCGNGRLTNEWIVRILRGDIKIRIESDRQSSLNQEVKKSRCNRAARLASETVSDTRRERKKTLVNKYIVDLNTGVII